MAVGEPTDHLAAVPTPASVSDTIVCRSCGYNLYGLPSDGACPECGTSVSASYRGDLLQFSKPSWIRSIRVGVLIELTSFFVLFFLFIVRISLLKTPLAISSSVPGAISTIIAVVGIWLFTIPDPSGLGEDRYGRSRRIIRITVWATPLSIGIRGVLHLAAPTSTTYVLIEIVEALLTAVNVVGTFYELNYLSQFSMRLPDDYLVNRAHFLMYALGGTRAITLVLGWVFARLPVGKGATGIRAVVGIQALLVVLAEFAFLIMYAVMLFRLAARLKMTAEQAETNWNTDQMALSRNAIEPLSPEFPPAP